MLVSFVSYLNITSCLDSLSIPTEEQIPVVVGEVDEPCAIPPATASFLPLCGCSVASFPPSCSWISGMSEKYQKSWHLTQAHIETWNNLWVGKLLSLSAVCNQGNEMNPNHCIWNLSRKCPLFIIFLYCIYFHCQEQTPSLLQCRWCFSSVDLLCDFPSTWETVPRPKLMCVQNAVLKVSKTEKQLSLSSVSNRKFNLLGGKS